MPLPALHLQFVQASVKTVTAPELSFRGAKRRGNLVQAAVFSPGPSCYPAGYCEIATAPLGPRNDKLGSLAPLNLYRKQRQPAWRSVSAATDAIGACHFNDALYESAVYRRERHAAPLQRSVGNLANYQLSTFHFPFAARRVPLQSFIRLHIAELARRAAGILAERIGEGR